ncbi:MAG: hypothetical protein RR138_05120 [Akkermansia sp.]
MSVFIPPVNLDIDLKLVRANLFPIPPPPPNQKRSPQRKGHLLALSISIFNAGDAPIRLLGKKWLIDNHDGNHYVFESSHIFNVRPLLCPNQLFAINGFHEVNPPSNVFLTLFGRDNDGNIFRTATLNIHPPEKRKRTRR